MHTDGPVVVHLVVHLHLHAVVLVPPGVGLEMGGIGEFVLCAGLEADWGAFEMLGAISSVVGHFISVMGVIVVLVDGTRAHEVLLKVGADESALAVLGILGSPCELGPELLEVLGVVFEVDASVVLVVVGEAEARLDLDLCFVVVLNVFLKNGVSEIVSWKE